MCVYLLALDAGVILFGGHDQDLAMGEINNQISHRKKDTRQLMALPEAQDCENSLQPKLEREGD